MIHQPQIMPHGCELYSQVRTNETRCSSNNEHPSPPCTPCAARYVVAAVLGPSAIQATNNTSRSSQAITAGTPSPLLRLVNTNGRVSRIFFASQRITSRSAPIAGARSILLITNKSEHVTPGPPYAAFYRLRTHR